MQRLPEVADDGAAAAASPAVAGDDGSEQCAGRCRPIHGQHRLESVAEWGAHRPGTGGESQAAGRPRGGERAVDGPRRRGAFRRAGCGRAEDGTAPPFATSSAWS